MSELRVPAKTVELSMVVHSFIPFQFNYQSNPSDGLHGEAVTDPSLIYICADDDLLLSISYTEMIDLIISCHTDPGSEKFDVDFRSRAIAMRDYLIKQAERLTVLLPIDDSSNNVISIKNKGCKYD